MLVFRIGLSVKDVSFMSKMIDWDEDDCRRVGRSISTFMRTFQQGQTAIDAWTLNYPQLTILFNEAEGKSKIVLPPQVSPFHFAH